MTVRRHRPRQGSPTLRLTLAVLPLVPWLLWLLPLAPFGLALSVGLAHFLCLWAALRVALQRRLGPRRWGIVAWLCASPALAVVYVLFGAIGYPYPVVL